MKRSLSVEVSPQPDNVTCGPTCLHAIYRYYGEALSLNRVIDETRMLEEGGTLDVFLANHALQRGYAATIYTYNLQVFDPTWFGRDEGYIAGRLKLQSRAKRSRKLRVATRGYLDFIELGGRLRFQDLTPTLIRRPLKRGVPMLTGLSATYLYHSMREIPETCAEDDLSGEPTGHFVVVSGYDAKTRQVEVSDPYRANPYSDDGIYAVDIRRFVGAVLLGASTYDANLLLIEPRRGRARGQPADR
jgi:hypothetical protein